MKRFIPSREEARSAVPGLLVIVIPIIICSEIMYALESYYVESAFHLGAPLIALMIAAVISIVITNVITLPPKYSPGLVFSTKWLLKIGIVLYGLNFSYLLWFKPGAGWMLVIGVVAVGVPLFAGYYLGKVFHLEKYASILIAVGTGICGISAIVATQQALKTDEEQAGMALATILVFGTFVLFLYPLLQSFLSLSSSVYGIWTGATTLDLPQLVAAALQGGGNSSLTFALWVKSVRIGLLAPVILILAILFGKEKGFGKISKSFPLFIVAFFGLILLNTLYPMPSSITAPLATGSQEYLSLNVASVLLTAAIIGICFRVRKDVVGKSGFATLFTGGLAWGVQSVIVFYLAYNLPIHV